MTDLVRRNIKQHENDLIATESTEEHPTTSLESGSSPVSKEEEPHEVKKESPTEVENTATKVDPHLKYQQLIHYIIHYTRGEIDTTQFEDECRTVLGNNAYFLFTIDKLCNNIIKYLHGFMSDTTFDQIKVCYMDSHINQ